jgi:hypothetical protein
MGNSLAKLENVLNRLPLTDEPDVVYMMTQLRKLFELDPGLNNKFTTLSFYINWTLHVRLDRNRALKAFCDEVLPFLV